MRRGLRIALLLAGLATIACGSGPAATAQPVTVTIAAASSLRFALDEIVEGYEAKTPGVDVVVTYGASGSLYGQAANGAPFDAFFAADMESPRRLEADGLAPAGSARVYATGRIVIWVRDGSPIDVEALGLDALVDPSVRRIAIANPEVAPYGRAAMAAIETAGLGERVAGRFALGENVSQAAQFVESGAAEIGIIALSLAVAPTVEHRGHWFLVPAEAHPPIGQGVVVLDRAVDPAATRAFVDHVLGGEGQEILARYGFPGTSG